MNQIGTLFLGIFLGLSVTSTFSMKRMREESATQSAEVKIIEGTGTFYAYIKDKQCGSLSYQKKSSDIWEMLELWVEAEYRWQHIGFTLLKHFVEYARSCDCHTLKWDAMPRDHNAKNNPPNLQALITIYTKIFKKLIPTNSIQMMPDECPYLANMHMSIIL